MQTRKVEKEGENGGKGINDNGSGLSKQDLEKIIVNYDNSIKGYEAHYRHKGNCSHGITQDYSQEYNESPYIQELSYAYDQALSEYEETLGTIERALSDFNEAYSYADTLEQKEQEEYIKDWKEYLENLLDTAGQLADSLKETIQYISGEVQA